MEQVFGGLRGKLWDSDNSPARATRIGDCSVKAASIRYALVEHEGFFFFFFFPAVAGRLHEKEMTPASLIYYT